MIWAETFLQFFLKLVWNFRFGGWLNSSAGCYKKIEQLRCHVCHSQTGPRMIFTDLTRIHSDSRNQCMHINGANRFDSKFCTLCLCIGLEFTWFSHHVALYVQISHGLRFRRQFNRIGCWKRSVIAMGNIQQARPICVVCCLFVCKTRVFQHEVLIFLVWKMYML